MYRVEAGDYRLSPDPDCLLWTGCHYMGSVGGGGWRTGSERKQTQTCGADTPTSRETPMLVLWDAAGNGVRLKRGLPREKSSQFGGQVVEGAGCITHS